MTRSAIPTREFKLMLAIALVVCVVCLVPVRSEAEVTEWVQRRQSADIYKTNASGTHQLCDNVTRTYLVDINQCVEDKQLLKGCNYSVVPMESSQLIAIAHINSNVSNLTRLLKSDDSLDKNARFYTRETKQALNNSLCHVVSLEVYRGRDKATEIRHDGFSISYDGSIELQHTLLQINKGQLAYTSEQFEGELFRMNLSCSNIPESGCLFFKVKGKIFKKFITNAKFNCTVPGTLSDFSDECNITMTTTTSPTSPTKIVNSVTVVSAVITTNMVTFKNSSNPTLLIALAGCIMLFTLCIIIACSVIMFQRIKQKRQSHTFSEGQTVMQDNLTMNANAPFGRRATTEPLYGSEPTVQSILSTSAENGMVVNPTTHANVGMLAQAAYEETEHLYAVLEQTQQHENTAAIELDEATTAQSIQPQLLDQTADNGGSSGETSNKCDSQWKSRPMTLDHPSKLGLHHSSKDFKFELLQIYDKVTPIRNTLQEREEEELERLCHSNPHRKRSLPGNLAIFHSSTASQPQNHGLHNGLGSSSDMLEEFTPVYSVPDMKKEREAHQRKKEKKDREASMEIVSTSSCPTSMQIKGVSILTERDDEASNQDHTYYNIAGHDTLWADYDDPMKFLSETCDGNHYIRRSNKSGSGSKERKRYCSWQGRGLG